MGSTTSLAIAPPCNNGLFLLYITHSLPTLLHGTGSSIDLCPPSKTPLQSRVKDNHSVTAFPFNTPPPLQNYGRPGLPSSLFLPQSQQPLSLPPQIRTSPAQHIRTPRLCLDGLSTAQHAVFQQRSWLSSRRKKTVQAYGTAAAACVNAGTAGEEGLSAVFESKR